MALTTMAMILSLAGTSWAMPDTPRQYVEFKPQQIFGHAGCNTFTGKYDQDNAVIKMGPLSTTRMSCGGDLMRKEAKFLHNLEHSTNFEIIGKVLTFKNETGDILLSLNRKDVG